MALTKAKREKVEQLIRDHFLALKVEVLGEDAISQDDYNRLVRTGVLNHGSTDQSQVAMQAAHTVGKQTASNSKLARMTSEQFWGFVESAPPQFNVQELDAMNAAREHVGRAITFLGVGLLNEFDTATQEDRVKARHEALKVVQHEVALGIARDSSTDLIMRRLKKKLGESASSWALTVATELHNAQEHGKALEFARQGDPVVYKVPRDTACKFCKMLFLKNGVPRLFKLSTLVANGTNVGRKAGAPKPGKTDWKPVIGVVHPACQCELHRMPNGMAFNKQGVLVPSVRKAIPDDLPLYIQALLGHRCEAS